MEVFFCRPGSNSEVLERIKLEIKYAKKRVLIAQYFMTEEEVAQLVKECRVEKRVILDGDRGFYANDPYIVNLGSPNHKSYMHHKFLIVDDVLWTGTLNLSKNGSESNWENMMRITNKDIVDLYVNEFKRMYVLGKALAKSTLKPETFSDPFEHFSLRFTHEFYLNVGHDRENRVYFTYVDEVKSVKLNQTNRKVRLDYRLFCESCKKKLDTDRLNWCYFQRFPIDNETEDFVKEPEIDEDEKYSSLTKRLCYECMYDYLEDNAMLEENFKPDFVENIDPSSLEDNEGKWVELKDVKIDSIISPKLGSLFLNVSKNSEKVSIYLDSRVGININDIQREFKKGDFINAIGISSVYSANGKKVVQLRVLELNDITVEK